MLYEDNVELQQQIIDKLMESPLSSAQVFRELYVWGLIRKNRDSTEESKNVSLKSFNTIFYFQFYCS